MTSEEIDAARFIALARRVLPAALARLKALSAIIVLALLLCTPLAAGAQVATPTTPVTLPDSTAKYVLTSTSPTACTTLAYVPTGKRLALMSIVNTGPALSVYPKFFDDTKCTVQANVIFGDGSTVTLGAGQIINGGRMLGMIPQPLGVLTTGLSYTLSGALSSTATVIITTAGIGF